MSLFQIKDTKNHPTRYYSNKQEKQVAQQLNGKQTSNSGATLFQKGDVLTDKFLLEMKTKTKSSDSISVKKEWFDKNIQESMLMGKPYTAIVFNFGPNEENHYIINEELFEKLIQYLDEG